MRNITVCSERLVSVGPKRSVNIEQAGEARSILFVDARRGGVGIEIGEGSGREQYRVERGGRPECRGHGYALCGWVAERSYGGAPRVIVVAGGGELAELRYHGQEFVNACMEVELLRKLKRVEEMEGVWGLVDLGLGLHKGRE